jgi:two-component system response regulator CpxR
MEMGTRVVRRAGKIVDLTAVEYDVLEKLLRAAGRILTREELSKQVLGRDSSPFDRSIDMHISNLRKNLGHHVGDIERIKTVRGVGYIYAQTTRKNGE